MRAPRRRPWRAGALAAGVLAVALWVVARPGGDARRLRREIRLAQQAAARVAPSVQRHAATLAQRWVGGSSALLGSLETRLSGLALTAFSFATWDGAAVRRVEALLWTPAGAAADSVTLYLPSSGARRGPSLDLEGAVAALALPQPRRVLVLPLPVREQRGPPWIPLGQGNLTAFRELARQTAVDVQAATHAAGAAGWRVEGWAGFSLGGCLVALLAGLMPEAVCGGELDLWAAGGDLAAMASQSLSHLTPWLSRPFGCDDRGYQHALVALDPARHLGRTRVARLRLTGARNDRLMPPACVEALATAARGSRAECEVRWVNGGHLAALGIPEALWRRVVGRGE